MSFERLFYIVSDEIILHSNFSRVIVVFLGDKCLFGISLPIAFMGQIDLVR